MNAETSFGSFAKKRRRDLGLSQEELARRVGCAPITLRKIEADDLRPSIQIAERLAMALNIPLEERAEFVRLARAERVIQEPDITPLPAPEEIGSADLSGRAIRGYALGERLGKGGMGAVYRAVQPLVEREVAIKIILPMYANHPDFIRRFEAEAQLVARLEHPHIVPLYDYWREPGVAYLIMRLLRGGSLHTLLRSGAELSKETVLRIMEQVGSALSASHRAGVIHRDLKPANVLLDEDNNAYLADFGIAKNLSNSSFATQTDVIIGSLDYLSPEQIRSEFVRPQTDIYAFGVLLYELLTGSLPFHGQTPFDVMAQHLNTPMPALSVHRGGLPKSLDAIIQRATDKDPLQRYENVDLFLNDLRPILGPGRHESTTRLVAVQPLGEVDNPYKGLHAFVEGDAQDFYGRETLTQQLLVRLGESGDLSRILTIVGPSGSGKSSIVKAGLIPALRRGALPGSENWFIVEMMPGAHPLEELEAALLRVAVNPPASLIEQFQKDHRGLIRAVRRSLPVDPAVELVLVIDQFEELFTLLQDEAERVSFLGLLVAAILDENSRVRVILTMRADFIDRPLGYMDFADLIHQRMELVLPLTLDELESAITSPAERVGLQLEAGLVAAILHDLGDQPGTLPLLQYALTEMFEKRVDNVLTKSAYQEIGGVLGALGRRAEEVFTALDADARLIARQIFLRLVTLGEGVEDTRRRALIGELENLQFTGLDPVKVVSSIKAVLDKFGNARLLSFDRDPGTRGPTVEVAHEAIIREWPRLRSWLEDSRTLVRMQRQLALTASEWLTARGDPSFLLSGAKLAQYEGWVSSPALALTQQELDYLAASLSARDQQAAQEAERLQRELQTAQKLAEAESSRAELQSLSTRRLRVGAIFLSVALLVALVFAGMALYFGNQANQNVVTARANEKVAVSRELAAAALSNLEVDPALSILLALQAESTNPTFEAENALHRSVLATHLSSIIHIENGATMGVAYSPDGQTLATADFTSMTAKIWTANTGQPIRTLTGHTAELTGIVYSPDGKRVATSSYDKTVIIWDLATGKALLTLKGHTDWVNNLAYSPDGRQIVTAGKDKTAIVWDALTGKQLVTFTDHRYQVDDVAFSPDGKQVASSGRDGNVRVWDASTGKESLRLSVVSSNGSIGVLGVAYSPDGKRIAAVCNNDIAFIKMFDAATGQEVFSGNLGHTAQPRDIAFSKTGRLAATVGDDQKVKIWDSKTAELLFTFSGHTGTVNSVAFSLDGSHLATAGWDGTVRIWSLVPPTEALFIPIPYNVEKNFSQKISYSADGKRLLSDHTDGLAHIWDAQSGQELLKFGNDNSVWTTTYSPDGKLAAIINSTMVIYIWDAQTGERKLGLLPEQGIINQVAFSPDGARLASAGDDGTAIIWDLSTKKQLFKLPSNGYALTSIAYSPDGKNLLTGINLQDGVIWSAETGEKLFTLPFSPGVSSAAYSPDGIYLALGSWDGTLSIWNARQIEAGSSQPLFTLKGQSGYIRGLAFSQDGALLASASLDGTVRVWEVATGASLLNLPVDAGGVSGVSFSPDGTRLAVGGKSGIYVLYMNIQDLILFAKSRVTRSLTYEECLQYLHTYGTTAPEACIY